jgi:hypothetical protein
LVLLNEPIGNKAEVPVAGRCRCFGFSPPRRCSWHRKDATFHICVRVDHASIPLGPFSHSRQYWYQAGYSLDVFHRIAIWQNIKLRNAEGANQDPLLLSSVQPGISHSKLGGIPDAKEIPVVRVLPESPSSGAAPRGAADRLGRLRDRGAGPGAAANAGGIDTVLAGRPGPADRRDITGAP